MRKTKRMLFWLCTVGLLSIFASVITGVLGMFALSPVGLATILSTAGLLAVVSSFAINHYLDLAESTRPDPEIVKLAAENGVLISREDVKAYENKAKADKKEAIRIEKVEAMKQIYKDKLEQVNKIVAAKKS